MKKVMRDALIEQIHNRLRSDDSVFFVSADFGAPALDALRSEYPDRFINVGIAEQNLINIATGLGLEGLTVYAYAIAPFLVMRSYEQIRNLSILAQLRNVNICLIGVGAGLSYDVTGPTHHCLEDLSLIQVLPNFAVFSPCDHVITERFLDYSFEVRVPKYFRLDGKPQPAIYSADQIVSFADGFHELKAGQEVGIISTGYMTHKALEIENRLAADGIDAGVIDVFLLKPINEGKLIEAISQYEFVFTMEEAFINKSGLDSVVLNILRKNGRHSNLVNFGFEDRYVFEVGDREYLHRVNGLDIETLVTKIKETLQSKKLIT